MNNHAEKSSLDAVLADYLVSSEVNGQEGLLEWIARYPQYEDELRELAAFQQVTEQIPLPEYTAAEEERLANQTISIVQNALYQQRHKQVDAQAERRITSLLDEAERYGMDIIAFAEQTGLSEGIVWAFEHRQVQYHTIAKQALKNIATKLELPVLPVQNYLRGGMQLAASHLKAEQTPVAAQPCTFADLVEIDEDLSDEQKQYWLSQPPISTEGK